MAGTTKRGVDEIESTISYVKDQPGHERCGTRSTPQRQVVSWTWQPTMNLAEGIQDTVAWYMTNHDWIQSVQTKQYRPWTQTNYDER